MDGPWFVYILLCADGSFYTGISKDPIKRLKRHKEGRGGAYTKSHPPIRLLYKEEHETRSEALKREVEIKKFTRRKKIATFNLIL